MKTSAQSRQNKYEYNQKTTQINKTLRRVFSAQEVPKVFPTFVKQDHPQDHKCKYGLEDNLNYQFQAERNHKRYCWSLTSGLKIVGI